MVKGFTKCLKIVKLFSITGIVCVCVDMTFEMDCGELISFKIFSSSLGILTSKESFCFASFK